MAKFFGTFPITANVRTTVQQVGPSGLSGVLLGNESPYHTIVTLDGTGLSRTLYPGTVDFFEITHGFNGNIFLDPSALLNNTASWPSEFVQVDTLGSNERPTGVYPYTLVRTTNQGSNVAATAIDNEGNPAGTQIITAIVAGDAPNKAVSMTNDGKFSVGTALHPGLISFDNALILSDGAGSWTVVILHTNTIEAPADGGASVLGVTAGNTRLQSSGALTFQIPAGTTLWNMDSAGNFNNIHGGRINFKTGHIQEINNGAVTTAGTVLVNHGLSTTPEAVLVCPETPAASTTFSANTYTATNFTLFNASGVSQSFRWVAYR